MSELINNRDNRSTIRWKLLTSASALALVSSMNVARAEDASHPLIWIELGGQMENVSGQGEVFTPPFLAENPASPVLGSVTPQQAQRPPKFDFGGNGTISFQPEDSDWVFSAAIRYGRSGGKRHVHHQTDHIHWRYVSGIPTYASRPNTAVDFADTVARHQENHAVLDFSAGKDVGLGMFGKNSSSIVSLGVRFAQFTSNSAADIRARPDLGVKYITYGPYKIPLVHFHTYHATGSAERSFHGIGPSLSWSGSAPFVGNPQDGEISIDWGANAAILFGKQRARVRHEESGHYKSNFTKYYTTVYPAVPHGHDTLRSVTVPNVGGMAGISFRKGDAKISFGYRADFFFGAMDVGIDAQKSGTLGFKGPFASISVGLGD